MVKSKQCPNPCRNSISIPDEHPEERLRKKQVLQWRTLFCARMLWAATHFIFLKDSGNPRKVNFPERIFLGSTLENRFFSSGFLQESQFLFLKKIRSRVGVQKKRLRAKIGSTMENPFLLLLYNKHTSKVGVWVLIKC